MFFFYGGNINYLLLGFSFYDKIYLFSINNKTHTNNNEFFPIALKWPGLIDILVDYKNIFGFGYETVFTVLRVNFNHK